MDRKAVAGAKVDVLFGHLERKDGRARLTIVNVAVPPREGDLVGLDPRNIVDDGRLVQTVNRLRFEQCPGTFSDHHHAPGRMDWQWPHNFRSIRTGREL